MDFMRNETNGEDLMSNKYQRDVEKYYKEELGLRMSVQENVPSEMVNNDKNFIARLDCSHYRPDDIEVIYDKTDHCIEVHGIRQDTYGWMTREFSRSYFLSEECDINDVKTLFRANGVLIVEAPKKSLDDNNNDFIKRDIPIKMVHELGSQF